MKKYLIGFVLLNLLLAGPALAVLNNGFDTDLIYAKIGHDVDHNDLNYGIQTGFHTASQATGGFTGGYAADAQCTSFCFSNRVNEGARLFTLARGNVVGGAWNDLLIKELDSAGNQLGAMWLGQHGSWAAGHPLAGQELGAGYPGSTKSSKDIATGNIRFNPVNQTLMISANPGHESEGAAKVWEIDLPIWGQRIQVKHEYTLPSTDRSGVNIAINPNDGTMYATGPDLGTTSANRSKGNVYSTPTNPSDPNFGINTLIFDGPDGSSSWRGPQGITYRESINSAGGDPLPEINIGMSWGTATYQPYAIAPIGGGGAWAQIGTPGNETAGGNNIRCLAIQAATDPLTGDLLMVGAWKSGTPDGGPTNKGGTLNCPPDSRYAGGSVVGIANWGHYDAASPGEFLIPEPATLGLLLLGMVPLLRRRR
jgi:hypothetical protein